MSDLLPSKNIPKPRFELFFQIRNKILPFLFELLLLFFNSDGVLPVNFDEKIEHENGFITIPLKNCSLMS